MLTIRVVTNDKIWLNSGYGTAALWMIDKAVVQLKSKKRFLCDTCNLFRTRGSTKNLVLLVCFPCYVVSLSFFLLFIPMET